MSSSRSSSGISAIAGGFVLTTCLTMSGCMIAKVEELRRAPTKVASGESVVVLGKPHVDGTATESSFMSCIRRKMLSNELPEGLRRTATNSQPAPASFQIIPERHFVDAMYPWLEYSTAPADASKLGTFLDRPGVREKVSSLGVRYVVWVDGTTKKTDGGGGVSCGISTAGAGCFGVGWWTKQSIYEAQVWDLQAGVGAGTINTSVTGTSVMIGAGVPIPLIARVQHTACDRLGAQLRSFLMGMEY